MERTLDLHAKIAASAPEHRERIERSLFADAEYPGASRCVSCVYTCMHVYVRVLVCMMHQPGMQRVSE